MAHHAFVALKAAATDPSLLPLVNRRLSERARKLANHYLMLERTAEAHRLARHALGLTPLNLKVWMSYAATTPLTTPIRNLILRHLLKRRRAAIDVAQTPTAFAPMQQN